MQPDKDEPCRCAASKFLPHRIGKCKLNRATNFNPANSLRNLVNQADLAGLTRTSSKSPQPGRKESNAPEYLDIPLETDNVIFQEPDESWHSNNARYPEAALVADQYCSDDNLTAEYELQAPPTISSLPSIVDTPVVTSPSCATGQPELETDSVVEDDALNVTSLPVAEEVSEHDQTLYNSQPDESAALGVSLSTRDVTAGPVETESALPPSPPSEPPATPTVVQTEQLYVPAAMPVDAPPTGEIPPSCNSPLWAGPEDVLVISGAVEDAPRVGANRSNTMTSTEVTDGIDGTGSGSINGTDGASGGYSDGDGPDDPQDGGRQSSAPTRSDPQCRCTASLAHPHRASKCKLRKSAHKVKHAAQTATQTVGKGVTKGVTALAQAPAPMVKVLRRRKGTKNKDRTMAERSIFDILWGVPRKQALSILVELFRTTVLFNLLLVGVLLLGMALVSGAMQFIVRLVLRR